MSASGRSAQLQDAMSLAKRVTAWHEKLGINYVERPGIAGWVCACHGSADGLRGKVHPTAAMLLARHDVPTDVIQVVRMRELRYGKGPVVPKQRPMAKVV